MRAALYLALLTACGDDGGKAAIDAPPPMIDGVTPRETIMENVPLAINEIVEGILKGGDGDIAHITMMAPAASLDWNMHSHPNGTTVVVKEEFKVMNVDYVFSPSDQADWYLLLRNKGQTDMTVQLKIELFGNMMWTGIQ
jgi:hypothetical protein